MGSMLFPGAGIYMVRGGGSCGDKHRVVTRVRHRSFMGQVLRKIQVVCAYTNTHTYTHTDNPN